MNRLLRGLACFLLAGSLLACRGGSQEPITEMIPAEPEIVAAHTMGLVSRESPIEVRFVDDVAPEGAVGQELAESPFKFDPPVAGKAVWKTRRDLDYQPEGTLTPGQRHRVAVDLSGLKSEWKDKSFTFEFIVLPQAVWMDVAGLEAAGDAEEVLRGTLRTADVVDAAAIEHVLTSTHLNDELKTEWSHAEDRRSHPFVIRGIHRQEQSTTLTLTVDGDPIGVERSEEVAVKVPGLTEFAVTSARAINTGDRHIELRFSDPLEATQNLVGLVVVDGKDDVRFVIDGSLVRVYSATGWQATHRVRATGVKNARGRKLMADEVLDVSFEALKPQVRFAGQGVIYPTTAGLTVPIEVANLRGVTIEAMRVFESNVPQFLQVNDLSGSGEMNRVGRVIWRQHVPIDMTPDRENRWVRVGLDVGPLVVGDPNGLYRLKLTFDRQDVVYDCPATPAAAEEAEKPLEPSWDEGLGVEESYWDFWDGEGMTWWEAYQNRNDPCHVAYYKPFDDHDITVSRNVMVSDLGLVAKMGADGSIAAIATDIKTASPLSGVRVTALDYQLQEIASGTSDKNGLVMLSSLERQPFALKGRASNGNLAWMRLDKGSALAMSHFDVSGATVADGLKGYFYGERGVWRPGDDIYLTFVLYDETGKIPDNHPIHFELFGPRGETVERRSVATSTDGFYRLTTGTSTDAVTGNYLARVKVGGATFTEPLRVDTVVPNRLKIEFDFGTEKIKAPDLRVKSTLTARWLHGAIAKELPVEVSYTLASKPTRFDRYPDYVFDDPTRALEPESQELFSGDLDDEGKVRIDEPLTVSSEAPGLLTATFKTRVFERSGAFSVDQHAVTVSPHERYIGLRTPKGDAARGILLTDTPHKVDIVAVDADGKPTGSGEVALALYKIDWRWWWEKGEEHLADYASSESHTPIAEDRIDLNNGVGEWSIQVHYPDWGRYLILATDVDGTHRVGKIVYFDWPGWAGRAQKDQPGGASVLSVVSEQKSVKVGDSVTITFPMSKGSRALVSLETGSTPLSETWVEPQGDTTTFTFTATEAMAPSVYANVTLLQPHLDSENDLPVRLYGVVPFEVFDPKTKLEPVVSAPDVLEPESMAKISVSEKQGRPMTYTLAVVDEGLLGLTRFKTPNAWDTFYQREALGVRTWDVFSMVAGAYGGALEGLLAIGGGGDNDGATTTKANRFQPVVRYYGPFTLAPGEKATHEVDIPQYVGEVRMMVVAGRDGAFGSAEKSAFVRKPLMVLATLPRVLGPGEQVELPVSVFALDNKVKDVNVSIEVEGPVEIIGPNKRSAHFSATGDKMVWFDISVHDELGVAKVHVSADGAGEKASHTIEIDVRHPGVRTTDVYTATVAPGQSWTTAINVSGMPGTNEAMLEISRVPPMNLGRRLDALIQYPHGCVEQTTSSVFPQVYLTKLLTLPPEKAHQIDRNVKEGVSRLRSFQTGAGGFAYWPGGPEADDWGSSYAGHFLVEAERAGYLLPSGMLDSWTKFQRERANRWVREGEHSDLEQAYRLYTLALAGKGDLGSMNRLRELRLSPEATWRLAAAYQLAGQPEVAKQLASVAPTTVQPYIELSETYGSDLRDEAMILETLVLLADPRQQNVALTVSKGLTDEKWLSTQTTAYALIAMARYVEKVGSGPFDFSWSLDGGVPSTVKSDKPLLELPLPVKDGTRPTFTLKNPSGGALFPVLKVSGLPRVGDDKSASNGLTVSVTYTFPSGGPAEIADIDHGSDFYATVSVGNTTASPASELALTQIVPSGWEIFGVASGPGADFDYRDVRDDRVYTYFDLGPGEAKTFVIKLNAAYQGKFYLAPISVEAMYNAALNGRAEGRWVEVSELDGQG